MYKHILNLKKKVSPKIVEKIIFKRESVFSRILRTTFSIAIAFCVIWSVSKAAEMIDELLPQEDIEETVSFSAVGIVKEVTAEKIILDRVAGVSTSTEAFEVDIADNEQIVETNTYEKLLISDVVAGDKIIIQGFKRDNIFYSRRIISFSPRFPDTEGIGGVIEPEIAGEEIPAELVATTTEELLTEVASTTDELVEEEVSTSTDELDTETSDQVSTTTDDTETEADTNTNADIDTETDTTNTDVQDNTDADTTSTDEDVSNTGADSEGETTENTETTNPDESTNDSVVEGDVDTADTNADTGSDSTDESFGTELAPAASDSESDSGLTQSSGDSSSSDSSSVDSSTSSGEGV